MSRLREHSIAMSLDGFMAGPDQDAQHPLGVDGIGATIMGRNMFGPVRGPWAKQDWRGWWGPNPPFHHPVFVLTHEARAPLEMDGGTTFHFACDGIESALEGARAAAGAADICLSGGASSIQQFLRAGFWGEVNVSSRNSARGPVVIVSSNSCHPNRLRTTDSSARLVATNDHLASGGYGRRDWSRFVAQ